MTEIKLPSGVTLTPGHGIFGVTKDLELTEGYDNFFHQQDDDGEDLPLSLEDRQFIAKMMIERWMKFGELPDIRNLALEEAAMMADQRAEEYFSEFGEDAPL